MLHAPVIAALARNNTEMESGARLLLHKNTITNITTEKENNIMHISFSLYLRSFAINIVTKVPSMLVRGSRVEIAAAVLLLTEKFCAINVGIQNDTAFLITPYKSVTITIEIKPAFKNIFLKSVCTFCAFSDAYVPITPRFSMCMLKI